mmetsp:Transcript_10949/g.44783  ORF Transcript_10949/g.44783 Transcript_10949/m.44783 type:complete len:317 (+) Transcript_10949:2733-3683(+)
MSGRASTSTLPSPTIPGQLSATLACRQPWIAPVGSFSSTEWFSSPSSIFFTITTRLLTRAHAPCRFSMRMLPVILKVGSWPSNGGRSAAWSMAIQGPLLKSHMNSSRSSACAPCWASSYSAAAAAATLFACGSRPCCGELLLRLRSAAETSTCDVGVRGVGDGRRSAGEAAARRVGLAAAAFLACAWPGGPAALRGRQPPGDAPAVELPLALAGLGGGRLGEGGAACCGCSCCSGCRGCALGRGLCCCCCCFGAGITGRGLACASGLGEPSESPPPMRLLGVRTTSAWPTRLKSKQSPMSSSSIANSSVSSSILAL